MTKYRLDIAGLRALAVLPILLFHAGVSWLRGGFIGVDVFFVISGFLITGIIESQISANRFSFFDFYRRRTVRIFPALFVLLLSTTLAAALLLFPYEAAETARSSAAAAAFFSNVFFWRTADYFAPAAETRPLLHTWSLGVEEQFYIFYPSLLLALRRWMSTSLIPVLWILTGLSFGLALWLAVRSPPAGFYLIPARAWELGLGALVALKGFPRVAPALGRQLLSVIGLLFIVVGVFVIRDDWSFPAPWGLLPCVGSALLIAYGETAVTARLLSMPALRWIGTISYSLYLWHWPIITFYRLRYGMILAPSDTALLLVLSFAAATISYFFIEEPFLRGFRTRGKSTLVVAVGAAALVGVVACCLWISAHATRFGNVPPHIQRVLTFIDYPTRPKVRDAMRVGICFSATGDEGYDPKSCLQTRAGARNILLIGDSTAAHYAEALRARSKSINLLQATASGCRPVIGTVGLKRCEEIVKAGFDKAFSGDVQEVIIAGLWEDADYDKFVATVRTLRQHRINILVVGPPVKWDDAFPKVLARAMMQHAVSSISRYRSLHSDKLDARMRIAAETEGARYVSPVALECPQNRCVAFADGNVPISFDFVHLTLPGARLILSKFPPL